MLIKNNKTDIKSLVYGVYYVNDNQRYITFDNSLKIVDIQIEEECEVIDNKYSKYWIDINHKLLPKEWNYILFLEELVDNPAPLNDDIFREVKERIDKEFLYYDICKIDKKMVDINAIEIGESWVLCPECDEAFEVDKNSKIINCNSCEIELNNPYYNILSKGLNGLR